MGQLSWQVGSDFSDITIHLVDNSLSTIRISQKASLHALHYISEVLNIKSKVLN